MKRMKCMLVGAALCAMSLCGGLYAQETGEDNLATQVGAALAETKLDGEEVMGVVAIVSVFVTIILAFAIPLLFSYLKKRRSYKVVEAAILHGQQLPPEFFDEGKPQRSFLQRGVTQIAVGVALTVAVGVVVDWDIALFGLVVVALGVGNVLAHFLGAKEQKTDGQ